MSKRYSNYLPGIVLLCLCVILALFIYKDHGMSWDEPAQREMGEVSYEYVTKHDRRLDKYIERDHGTGFELILIFIERKFQLEDTRDIYQMRHLVSHLFFLVCCFFGYILCFRLFRNNVIACIGFLMFVFHPRIFNHSFFNTKDLPFLGAFLVALTVCQLAFDKDKQYLYLIAGAACGYATSIRMLGILLVCIIIPIQFIDLGKAIHKKEQVKKKVTNLVLFIIGSGLMLFISFPSLWAQPFMSFVEVLQSLSHFRWIRTVLLDGHIIHASQLPWTYLPIWFGNTMPIGWLFIGIVAILWLIFEIIRRPVLFFTNTWERNFLIYLACFLLPILSIIFLRSVVYDDWRHIYFVYPPFVLLVLYIVNKLYANKKTRITILAIMGIQFAEVGYFMVKEHPHQQVYFNHLVPDRPEFLRFNYDMDYWGVAYKQGLEYILKNDQRTTINIWTPELPLLWNNVQIIRQEERQRLHVVGDENDADYILTNFRFDPADPPYTNTVYEIKVLNSTILRVYKVK